MILILIGSAWSAVVVVAAAVVAVVAADVAVVAAHVVATSAACSGLVAANCSTSLPCAVASGTFPVLATTTSSQSTRRRAVRPQAPGGARFHRVQPGLSDG